MSNWQAIPHEILNIIFLYLENSYASHYQKDLAQCALTCRDWRVNAQTVYFSRVQFKTAKQLNTMDYLVSNNCMLGKWVKTLDVLFTVKNDELLKIDILFPRLEKLHLQRNYRTTIYSFFCKIMVEDGKFSHLTEIPKPLGTTGDDELYLQCLMFMKNRINRIDLGIDYTGTAEYRYIKNNLFQFPNLKEVALCISAVEKSPSRFILYHLESLTKNGTNSIEKYSLDFHDCHTSNMPYSTENLKSLSSIVPAVNVKQLQLYTLLYEELSLTKLPDDEFMLYIMKKFPSPSSIELINKLHYKEVADESSILELDYKHLSKTVAIEFLKYVSKLSYSRVKNFITCSRDNTGEIIQGLYSDFKENSTASISRCLKMLYEEPIMTASGIIEIRYPHVFIDFEAKKNNRTLSIIFDTHNAAQVFQQQLDLIEQAGRFFNHIYLEISSNDLTSLFKHVAKYCVQLKKLTFEYQRPLAYEVDMPKNYNISILTLDGSLPSSKQLEYILNQLPSLKNLALDISSLLRRKAATLNRVTLPSIYLPDISLKCLELHVNAAANLACAPLSEINGYYCLKLITESNEKARYYLLNAKCNDGYSVVTYNLMEDCFKDGIQNDASIFTLYFHFKSVKKFTIKYPSSLSSVYNDKVEEANLFSEEDASSNK